MTWVDELREHEPVYARAPSAHNTQPWVLDYRPDQIVITADPARSLPGSDPTGRDLALGLGAFTETCLIVAADAGLRVAADLSDPRRVRLIPAPDPYATPFTAADITARRVARGPYRPGPVDPPGVPGVLSVPARELAGDLAVADRWMFAQPAMARELRDWLRLTPRHPRYHQDGLTDRALELSRPEAWALDRLLRWYPVTRRLGLPTLLSLSGNNLLRYDGTVLILTGHDPDLREAGRRLMRTWLTLSRQGLAVHPLSQLLDCPPTAIRLANRLGAPPLAVFRVGHPINEPARSARR